VSIASAAVTQFAFRRKKSKTVLLVGLNGAGKTALFYQVPLSSSLHSELLSLNKCCDLIFFLDSDPVANLFLIENG